MSPYLVDCWKCHMWLGIEAVTSTERQNIVSHKGLIVKTCMWFHCQACGSTTQHSFDPDWVSDYLETIKRQYNNAELAAKVFAFDMEIVDTVEDFLLYCGRKAPREA